MSEEDWRLRGQEEYMQNQRFRFVKFKSKDGGSLHKHCDFCWYKFMENCEGVEDCSEEGYCTDDGRYWVCKECYQCFRSLFNWETIQQS